MFNSGLIAGRKFQLLLLFLFSFLVCITINLLNVRAIRQLNPANETINAGSLVHNRTVYSVDNWGYTGAIKNYLEQGIYAEEKDNPYTRVRRTPGYPLFLGIHFVLFGYERAYSVIPYTQSLLYALSVVMLWVLVVNFTGNTRIAWISGLLYSICPFALGYTFFTITESIYPAFVIFAAAVFSLSIRCRRWYYAYLCGLFIALAFLIRPTNGLLLVIIGLVLVSLWFRHRNTSTWLSIVRTAFLIALGILTLESIWVFRNYKTTNGELVLLEKFFNESPMSMGRSQTYFSKWTMCFSNPHPEVMVYRMIEANKLPDSVRYQHLDKFIGQLPAYAFAGYGKAEVREALVTMQQCYKEKEWLWGTAIKTLKPGEPEPGCEFETKRKFTFLIEKFRANDPVRYYIIAPYITRGKEFIFQSFTSMFGGLNPAPGKFSLVQKGLKGVCYLFNVLLFCATILFAFIRMHNLALLKILSIGFPLGLYIIITNLVHIEARYFLAAYPFMVINLSVVIYAVMGRAKPLFISNKANIAFEG